MAENKKYRVIYADPPWQYRVYSQKGAGRSAESHYPTMSISDIRSLPVAELADKDCALFLWVTMPCLMGYWTRSNVEFCVLATKGSPKRMSAAVHQVIMTHIEEHSKKPQEARDRIVQLMGDVPRFELFARQKTEGWDVWGNDVESDITMMEETNGE